MGTATGQPIGHGVAAAGGLAVAARAPTTERNRPRPSDVGWDMRALGALLLLVVLAGCGTASRPSQCRGPPCHRPRCRRRRRPSHGPAPTCPAPAPAPTAALWSTA